MHMQYLSETVVCKYSNCSMEFMLLEVLVLLHFKLLASTPQISRLFHMVPAARILADHVLL